MRDNLVDAGSLKCALFFFLQKYSRSGTNKSSLDCFRNCHPLTVFSTEIIFMVKSLIISSSPSCANSTEFPDSITIRPHHQSLLGGPLDSIKYPHNAGVYKFMLVV